jgi:hypothetical protein
MAIINDRKPLNIGGIRVWPPFPNADPRQLLDFATLWFLVQDNKLPEDDAVAIARAYLRLHPTPADDSTVG